MTASVGEIRVPAGTGVLPPALLLLGKGLSARLATPATGKPETGSPVRILEGNFISVHLSILLPTTHLCCSCHKLDFSKIWPRNLMSF